jgi:hypothetical protein
MTLRLKFSKFINEMDKKNVEYFYTQCRNIQHSLSRFLGF